MTNKDKRFNKDTQLIHAGRSPQDFHGFVNPPVCHGSTVLYPTADDFRNHRGKYTYARRGNPTMDALSEGLKELYTGSAGVVSCPSGLAAISTAILGIVSAGDHILVTDSVYLPTRQFCDSVLKRLGVETTYYDPHIGANIASLFRPNTRVVYLESPGSLSFEIQDVPAIAQAAKARNILVLMDNTWAGPVFCDAHRLGVDLIIESGTKYLVGHSDAMIGTVSANESCWKQLHHTWGTMGICVGPDDIYFALRGLRTLSVRLKQHQSAALEIARWLEGRPEVKSVWHPALPQHPGHALWKRDFTGSSGLFSIVLHEVPEKAVDVFLDSLALFGMGYSWGGFESLVIPFSCASFRTATQWNPGGTPLRFHIGLEDVKDLIADIEQGFAAMKQAL